MIELPFLNSYHARISEITADGMYTLAIEAGDNEPISAAFAKVDQESGEVLSYGFLPEPTYFDPDDGSVIDTGSSAFDVNTSGQIVGDTWDGEGDLYGANPDFYNVFSWDGPGLDLELYPSATDNNASVVGINDADSAVGISIVPSDDLFPEKIATLWESDENGITQVIDLQDEIPSKPNYTLKAAIDVNNDGWISVHASKFRKGQYTRHALLLVPNDEVAASAAFATTVIPEPSTFTLFILGAAVLTARRRK